VPVLTAHLLAFVHGHFMAFSFFSAGHECLVFPLFLKANNIETLDNTIKQKMPAWYFSCQPLPGLTYASNGTRDGVQYSGGVQPDGHSGFFPYSIAPGFSPGFTSNLKRSYT
jgi:hypothetical protein